MANVMSAYVVMLQETRKIQEEKKELEARLIEVNMTLLSVSKERDALQKSTLTYHDIMKQKTLELEELEGSAAEWKTQRSELEDKTVHTFRYCCCLELLLLLLLLLYLYTFIRLHLTSSVLPCRSV